MQTKSTTKGVMFIGTYNNIDTTTCESFINSWVTTGNAAFATGQLEKGAQGTIHLQFFIHMKTQTRTSALFKHAPGVHFTTVGFDNGAAEYCNKEDTRIEGPWTAGIRPARLNQRGDKKRRNKELIEKGAEQAVNDGDIRIEDYPKVKMAIDYFLNCTTIPIELNAMDNQWHYGRPGAGKTSHCSKTYPGYYEKDKSKYWNGYTN